VPENHIYIISPPPSSRKVITFDDLTFEVTILKRQKFQKVETFKIKICKEKLIFFYSKWVDTLFKRKQNRGNKRSRNQTKTKLNYFFSSTEQFKKIRKI
jgi:alpha-acetolactate decarboxylase